MKNKQENEETKLTREELTTLQNLLFTGKWNLSMQETKQIIEPLINKLAKMTDAI